MFKYNLILILIFKGNTNIIKKKIYKVGKLYKKEKKKI